MRGRRTEDRGPTSVLCRPYHVVVGNENYFLSADGFLMPTKKRSDICHPLSNLWPSRRPRRSPSPTRPGTQRMLKCDRRNLQLSE